MFTRKNLCLYRFFSLENVFRGLVRNGLHGGVEPIVEVFRRGVFGSASIQFCRSTIVRFEVASLWGLRQIKENAH